MFTRYAIYYTPEGVFADAGAAWLGWDMAAGRQVVHPVSGGLDVAALTNRPRKYGFHGTVKAPFALADGMTADKLRAAVAALCGNLRGVQLDGLEVVALGRFLALVPLGDDAALCDLAAHVVRDLDIFRAPPLANELARRRKSNLSSEQDANLIRWGYPHVMGQFRFHMTLTGPIPRRDLDGTIALVRDYFSPKLPDPFVIDSLTLAGERPDGRFVEIERFDLQ